MRYAIKYITLIFTLMFLIQCKKAQLSDEAPIISFRTDSGFTFSDKTLKLGDTIRIGIIANSADGENITLFNTKFFAGEQSTSVDSGLNSTELNYERLIIKGISDKETWHFMVKNKAGLRQEISINLFKDSTSEFINITHIPKVFLGAQLNNNYGTAWSASLDSVFTINKAYQNQASIDFLYYYDFNGDENTISSPGGNVDTSIYGSTYSPSYWSTRNTTRFELTTLTVQDFDNSYNDSLIYANTFDYASGKRKSKNLKTNDIYSFVLNNAGKKGFFKVLSVEGTTAGKIEIEIKMQN
ncbi:MAG: hypothetical protein A2033_18450 [Bacteroidetes bacterium GWA2_31_9]|nr:MAG: hypothetical protein A2033_18450 [Bacteroidetes bacterium GWA2_31_9]